MILLFAVACSEYRVHEPAETPVAEPPGEAPDDFGAPPDWSSCGVAYAGRYANLPADHPDVALAGDTAAPEPQTFEGLDWWDDQYRAFDRDDPSLDFGEGWWPVDEGLAGDPAYFAARWRAWIRVTEGGTQEFLFGSADDGWVAINGALALPLPGIKPFEPQVYAVDLAAGQYPLEIRFAQRSAGESGLRFRPLSEGLQICYPDFSEE